MKGSDLMNGKAYNYAALKADIERLKTEFKGLETGSIGLSVRKRELFYLRLGSGKNRILYNGAHHGMEWITSMLLMKAAEDTLCAKRENRALCGFSVSALFKNTSLYIVPMLNPDGVELETNGLSDEYTENEKNILIKMNKNSSDFSRWQANINGVDLNHNYDALWEKSKAAENEYSVFGPGPTRFSGTAPESEPESRALADFTRKLDFKLTISFHSQGKVIYHGFKDKEPAYSLSIARAFEKLSPYRLDTAEGIASYAGFKDWFVDKFNRPGFTIEVGLGQNPLPVSDFPEIYAETLPIILGAMTISLP